MAKKKEEKSEEKELWKPKMEVGKRDFDHGPGDKIIHGGKEKFSVAIRNSKQEPVFFCYVWERDKEAAILRVAEVYGKLEYAIVGDDTWYTAKNGKVIKKRKQK